MAMGKSFNKSILFVLGIVLVVSAFSGCTDADAPSAPAYEQAVTDEEPAATNAPTAINAPAVTNEPTNTENSDIQPSGAELYKELLTQGDPEAFKQLIGMNINDLKIKGLGTPTRSQETYSHWSGEDIEPAGLTTYSESYYPGGLVYGLYFKNNYNYFQVSADNDGKINEVAVNIENIGRFLIDDKGEMW